MIESKHGDLLKADAEALINTVNTVGIMGKGIALQFRQAFPANYDAYRAACKRGEVELGKMFVVPTNSLTPPQWIINFPTKADWRSKSRMEDIEAGLSDLIAVIRELEIRSVAVPPLGCGNGGLDWSEVRPRIEAAFAELPDVQILLYAPEGAPEVDTMPVATKRPNMTQFRAALLGALERYALPGYRLTLLEIQKLAYFLQAAGQPLKLEFGKDKYGPYAEKLNHVLQNMEGHHLRGYGDRSRNASIHLLADASAEAAEVIAADTEMQKRLQRVADLIEGFETPHGLELLATVHWVALSNPAAAANPDQAIADVHAWNQRKRETFPPKHIAIAWRRLQSHHWFELNTE